MAKINKVRILLAAIAYVVISQVIHTVSSMLTMSYYTDPTYFPVWSKAMMPAAGPPPTEFYLLSIGFVFIVGLIYSLIYEKVKGIMKGTAFNKGLKYGLALFLMAGVPFFFSMYLLINLPVALLIEWLLVDGLVMYLLGGIAIARLNK
ncbi:MAG: hypothetical protein V1944_02085 [Candidatus Aenigmatarchaeota archaeon]